MTSRKIIYTTSQFVSIVLHPLLMGVYSIALLFVYAGFDFLFDGQFVRFILPAFIFTAFVPANGIFVMKKLNLIKDYELTDKSDRFLLLLLSFMCYILLYYYYYQAGLYIWFLALMFAPIIIIAITCIISFKWNISIHMIGIGSLIGGVMSVCYFIKGGNPYVLFIILFILAGCLGVARLYLRRHIPAQVYAGFALGFIITGLCVWIGANYTYLYLFLKLKFI